MCLWTSEAANFLIPMLAAHLNAVNTNAIRVWTIENGALEMSKLICSSPMGVVEHYDLMRVGA